MTENPHFEFPPELRKLIDKNVEQARTSYGQFMDFLTQAIEASSKAPPNALLWPVQKRAIEFARENAERFFGLASELARAKDIEEVLTLQSRYAQTQMHSCALQTQELGRLMANALPAFGRSISIP